MRFVCNIPREEALNDLMDVKGAHLTRDERRPMSRSLHRSNYPMIAMHRTGEANR